MKNIFIAAFTALAMTALVATSAAAGTVRGEVVFADIGSRADQTEYKLSYSDHVLGPVNGTVELSTRQADSRGDVNSSVVGSVFVPVNTFAGVTVTPRLELGETFRRGDNYAFYGVEAVASRRIVGPVSGSVGLRYRNAFENRRQSETRASVGLNYDINDRYTAGLTYYNTAGSRSSNTLGVSARAAF